MNIYIPKHLRRIKIIDQLCQLINKYSEIAKDGNLITQDSDYYYNKYKTLSYDPVKKFVGICISILNKFENREDKVIEQEINYITEIFYCVSGSYEIFNMLTNLLGFKMDEVNYQISTGHLQIVISSETYEKIFKEDEDLYNESFLNFLGSLLYFKKAEISYVTETIELKEINNVTVIINSECPIIYTQYEITPTKS